MKKYIFGVFAIALAVGFSSFGVKKAPLRFEYQLSTFAQADVEDVSNYAPGSSITCSGADKACMIIVDDQNTLNNGTQLDPNRVTIQALDHNNDGTFRINNALTSVAAPTWANKP